MLDFHLLKFLHILGAIVLLGTGTGIAFFMLMAHRSRDVSFIARMASVVVAADWIFTASAVVAQPVTGALLVQAAGWPWSMPWLLAALGLYFTAGLFWLPVVFMQMRMRDLAVAAMRDGTDLPAAYFRLFRWWFAFGIPGFGATLAIVWLMVAKPGLWEG